MIDLDGFIADCVSARQDSEPRRAIKEVLARVLSDSRALAETLPPNRAEIVRLHASPELTIIKVVWAPGMTFGAHNHNMWAAIGLYTGGEDNTFYRRDGASITESGGKALRPGDLCLLGDDTIHAVTNPTTDFAGALHIYGGDFFATQRSEWRGAPPVEESYDVERTLAYFEGANG